MKENGRLTILWKAPAGTKRLEIPCGRCVGCKLERSRNWAVRCVLESSLYDSNCFITLTFNDEHLPANRSLDKEHFPLFMRRLRKHTGRKIRYFHCGEYGGKLGRPHYHALLFNYDFPDKVLYTVRNDNKLYISSELSQLWPYGFSSVGDLTFASAAYVARYVMKKVPTKDAEDHYVDKSTGEILVPEYVTMSRRPGLASAWFERFGFTDVFPSDQLVVDGKVGKPPRFFDKILEKVDPQMYDDVKSERMSHLKEWNESSDLRLRVKEEVKLAQIKSLKRSLP